MTTKSETEEETPKPTPKKAKKKKNTKGSPRLEAKTPVIRMKDLSKEEIAKPKETVKQLPAAETVIKAKPDKDLVAYKDTVKAVVAEAPAFPIDTGYYEAKKIEPFRHAYKAFLEKLQRL